MNVRSNRNLAALVLAGLIVAGCANDQAYREGRRLLGEGRTEQGLTQLELAAKEHPGDRELRAFLFHSREAAANQMLAQADSARLQNSFDAAEAGYRRVLGIAPDNKRAQSGLDSIVAARRHNTLLAEAEILFKKGDADAAQARLRPVLVENPAHREARQLQRRIDEKNYKDASASPALKSSFKKPITLEFRDANLKSVFEVIARSAGINFIFDKDVRPDLKASIYVKNTSIEDAIKLLLVTNQLDKKIMNDSTVLIYPNIPAKTKEYQELTVKSFYLANADVKQTMNMIKALVKTRDIFVDEKLNLLIMRDTPEAVRLAEKLVATQDLAEPEVLLDVEVLEVSHKRLVDLGINPPTEASFTATGVTAGAFTLTDARNINSDRINVSTLAATVKFKMETGDTNLLANPRIRVKNREKAAVHIGEKVPVITTTVTSAGTTNFLPETVNYLDVGIKLEVEPNIYLEDDVSIKVKLEVSSLGQKTVTKAGSEVYRVGTRNVTTTLRLRDGETQALAGLINDEDRKTISGIPGLGDIPALGRLFSTKSDSKDKTEIVLLITPHVVRNLARPDAMYAEFPAGTEGTIGGTPLTLRPAEFLNPMPGVQLGTGARQNVAPVQPGTVIQSTPPGAPPVHDLFQPPPPPPSE
jgi:general secretion pathway protein D